MRMGTCTHTCVSTSFYAILRVSSGMMWFETAYYGYEYYGVY